MRALPQPDGRGYPCGLWSVRNGWSPLRMISADDPVNLAASTSVGDVTVWPKRQGGNAVR
jgi:hypothetical protein